MAIINENYALLKKNYLFAEVARRVAAFRETNPKLPVISLGIGDVTRPLCPAVVTAMEKACAEMGAAESFHGYGPDYGYDWLRAAIAENDYRARGVDIDESEIFVSDGAKSDVGNIGDIFSVKNTVLITDPVYPVYNDTNVMAGRRITLAPINEQNGFCPALPNEQADLIYLCSPNNPTGAAMKRDEVRKWVDYAIDHGSVIFFDSAYEAYISDSDVPHSIYEIDGAKKCAIEFRSFSKTAGFTGTRCAYTVVPRELSVGGESVNALWGRRQSTKFNGVPYIVQRGAEAVYSAEGKKQVAETIGYYMNNARVILAGLKEAGLTAFGGKNAPYIWLRCPDKLGSWEFFDKLLNEVSVVGTPGEGFGACGAGFFRLTAFGSAENTAEAVERIKKIL